MYADEFKYKESNTVESASGNYELMKKREAMINSALRFGSSTAKTKVTNSLESLTTFKPFTVKELEFEIWETKKSKQERYMK